MQSKSTPQSFASARKIDKETHQRSWRDLAYCLRSEHCENGKTYRDSFTWAGGKGQGTHKEVAVGDKFSVDVLQKAGTEAFAKKYGWSTVYGDDIHLWKQLQDGARWEMRWDGKSRHDRVVPAAQAQPSAASQIGGFNAGPQPAVTFGSSPFSYTGQPPAAAPAHPAPQVGGFYAGAQTTFMPAASQPGSMGQPLAAAPAYSAPQMGGSYAGAQPELMVADYQQDYMSQQHVAWPAQPTPQMGDYFPGPQPDFMPAVWPTAQAGHHQTVATAEYDPALVDYDQATGAQNFAAPQNVGAQQADAQWLSDPFEEEPLPVCIKNNGQCLAVFDNLEALGRHWHSDHADEKCVGCPFCPPRNSA